MYSGLKDSPYMKLIQLKIQPKTSIDLPPFFSANKFDVNIKIKHNRVNSGESLQILVNDILILTNIQNKKKDKHY